MVRIDDNWREWDFLKFVEVFRKWIERNFIVVVRESIEKSFDRKKLFFLWRDRSF